MKIFEALKSKEKKVAVIGLGYVGLPLALAMAREFSVVAFDHDKERVDKMREHIDPSRELLPEEFEGCDIQFTDDPGDLASASFYILAVPTPVDDHKVPDLTMLLEATERVGRVLKEGDYVVFESTVYPGCTEEECIPLLEAISELKAARDFKVGYSPERINPGDKVRTVQNILKVVAGIDDETLDEIARIYDQAVNAGVFKAASIKVAEAAKVIENTQRDLNISFINELAIIFDKMDINTQDVLDAASTKWNFNRFSPGLVGGHCIGVDPYYLLYKSKQMGYDPQVILSGRRINDGMPAFIAKKLVQMLIREGQHPRDCRILVMGLTFKENVSDVRNSKVADLVNELENYSITVHCVDPHASAGEVMIQHGITLHERVSGPYDATIVAVGHEDFKDLNLDFFRNVCNSPCILLDVKGIYRQRDLEGIKYWSL